MHADSKKKNERRETGTNEWQRTMKVAQRYEMR